MTAAHLNATGLQSCAWSPKQERSPAAKTDESAESGGKAMVQMLQPHRRGEAAASTVATSGALPRQVQIPWEYKGFESFPAFWFGVPKIALYTPGPSVRNKYWVTLGLNSNGKLGEPAFEGTGAGAPDKRGPKLSLEHILHCVIIGRQPSLRGYVEPGRALQLLGQQQFRARSS